MEPRNVAKALTMLQDHLGVNSEILAQKLECSIYSIARIKGGQTIATEVMCSRVKAIADKEGNKDFWAKLGMFGGATTGVAMSGTAVTTMAAAGTAGGAAITSGLAGVGAVVGGGMLAGIGVVAAAPVAAGLVGFGAVKGVKWLFSENKTHKFKTEFDPELERLP